MALSSNGKLNTPLLDTLIQLSDLVKSLQGNDFLDHINELKEKTEALNVARASTEPQIHALNAAREDNVKAAAEAKAALQALAAARMDHEKQLKKIDNAKAQVESAKADLDRKSASSLAEIEQKSQSVSSREQKAVERQKAADAVVAEYSKKLTELKKITG